MVVMRGTEQGPQQSGAHSHGNIRYGASLSSAASTSIRTAIIHIYPIKTASIPRHYEYMLVAICVFPILCRGLAEQDTVFALEKRRKNPEGN